MRNESEIINRIVQGRSTAESRWARFGPYYAMFPMRFACDVISKYTNPGDLVLDPFVGRGTSVFAAAALGRKGIGIEINPVGWVYSSTKLKPASEQEVLNRLEVIISLANGYINEASKMDSFYKICFSQNVLSFLLSAKYNLNWENSNIDRTLMAFILLYLHGKREQSLSNQMPMTKSTSKQYSIKWWTDNGYITPPEIDVTSFLKQRIQWRYKKGTTNFSEAIAIFGDCTNELTQNKVFDGFPHKVKLLFTSPPYYGVTNYFADQWLRMWVLEEGYNTRDQHSDKYKRRFGSKNDYVELLDSVFAECSNKLEEDAIIYVRTDIRKFTLTATKEILEKHFPNHRMDTKISQCEIKSQTELLGNKSEKPCEVDLILKR